MASLDTDLLLQELTAQLAQVPAANRLEYLTVFKALITALSDFEPTSITAMVLRNIADNVERYVNHAFDTAPDTTP